jgi:hypothetical protein
MRLGPAGAWSPAKTAQAAQSARRPSAELMLLIHLPHPVMRLATGLLNQSSIWAVESTWSSCLPYGNAVSSRRYSASDVASLGRCTKPFSIIAVCACMRMIRMG